MRRLVLFLAVLAIAVPTSAQAAGSGVTLQAARPWIGIILDKGQVGVLIKDVFDGTPASKAGLKKDDEILALDGVKLKDQGDLINRVGQKGVGQVVTLKIVREKKELTVKLALEAKPDELKLLRDSLMNKPAPAFALPNGGPSLAAWKGQVVVVEFWATWCGPCRMTMPRLGEWQKKYAARGLKVVGITDEDPPTIAAYAAKKNPGYPLGCDPKAKEAYRVPVIPMMVVIDRAGVVRYVEIGAGSKLDLVEQAFLPLLDAK